MIHKTLERQLRKATGEDGELDQDALIRLVSLTYEEHDNALRMQTRASQLMSDELTELNAAIRKERDETVAQSQKRFELAVEGANDGIWDWDVEKDALWLSARCKAMLGYAPEQLTDCRFAIWKGLINQADMGQAKAFLRAHLKGYAQNAVTLKFNHASGGIRHLMCRASAVRDEAGRAIRLVGVLTDITDLIAMQEELTAARDKAEAANAARGEFLANMSHEIRTPMNGVIGMTELLLETQLSEQQVQYARTVIVSAEALLAIINDILDFSKIESGKLGLEPIAFDLYALVKNIAELLAVKARTKAIELILRYIPGTPRYIVGDPVRVRQIISNLLGNAIKFTEAGHVLLMVEAVGDQPASADKVTLKLSIADTGIGIPPEAQGQIFEKFTQADTSTTRKFGGTGLGLAISRQLVEMMGGEIGVDSLCGKGSTFWFRADFPLAQALAEKGSPARSIACPQAARILVVDDIPVNLLVLSERLAAWNMRCTTCASSVAALELLRQAVAAGDPFHIALLDYLMPEMNGEELGKMIKSDPAIADTRLIMLSSADAQGHRQRCEKIGFAAVLDKPVFAETLFETMASIWDKELAAPVERAGADHAEDQESRFAGVKVLLAEDNRVNQEVAAAILTSLGCTVAIAQTGTAVLDRLADESFDIILMDCQMPEMSGYEASRALTEMKRQKAIAEIPIVALTASDLKEEREQCLAAGMVDLVEKPMRKKRIIEAFDQWLPKSRLGRAKEAAAPVPMDGLSVLLVEDNLVNREVALTVLEKIGCRTAAARDGQEAIAVLKRKKPVDLVLMDCQMPVMDGFEATRQIRLLQKAGELPAFPIIALTANAMKGDRERCLEAGMDDYLSKPVRKGELRAIIAKWLPGGASAPPVREARHA